MRFRHVAGVLAGLLLLACAEDRMASPAEERRLATETASRALPPVATDDRARTALGRAADSEGPVRQGPPAAGPMLIRTGQISIEVDSLEPAIRRVTEIAAQLGGFVANTSVMAGGEQHRRGTIEIKVPSDRYDGAVGRLREVGEVVSATTSSQDVGEEFVDVTARVGNARRLEERLIGILATRTGKLDDVLAVERELARVRQEIERYEGRLRYLEARVAMSTITVTVYEPGPLVGQPGSNPLVEALRQSWRNFVEVSAAGIALLGGLAPVVLVAGLAVLGLRRWWRRRRLATA